MKILNEFTPLEKRVIKTSAAMMMVFGLLYLNDGILNYIFDRMGGAETMSIADIVTSQNDVRYKEMRTYAWRQVPEQQTLGVGDSVFTGVGSKTTVQLKSGVKMEVGEQSLVRFRGDSDAVADLKFGGIKLAGTGEAKIRIQGQVVAVPLNGGNVEITQNKDGFKMKSTDQSGKVTERTIASVEVGSSFPPVLLPDEGDHFGFWTLDDLYARDAQKILRRDVIPSRARTTKNLKWKDLKPGKFTVQVSSSDEFKDQPVELTTEEKNIAATPLHVGLNFWRVKRDTSGWSEIQAFNVRMFTTNDTPILSRVEGQVAFFDDSEAAKSEYTWSLPKMGMTTLVEISSSPDFKSEETLVSWAKDPQFTMNWTSRGTYYMRLIGMNSDMQLSTPTAAQKIEVLTPPLLGPVRLPKDDLGFEVLANRTPRLSWSSPLGTAKNLLEVFDVDGRKIEEREVASEVFPINLRDPGSYSYRVTAVDRWGRKGAPGPNKEFTIMLPNLQLARAPDEDVQMMTKMPLSPLRWSNGYDRSFVQIEGASFGVFSSEQLAAGQSVPLAMTAALRWNHWWKSLGTEWIYRSKVSNYNAVASTVSPVSIEGRLSWRRLVDQTMLKFLREVQVSGFFGIEMYRNAAAGNLYTKGYDLFKIGTQLEIPLDSRWSTGGELVLGLATDSSKKYEFGGHLNYLWEKNWMTGLGYRAHAFEAGSPKTTPLGLPYREAYGEAFGSIRYNY